MCGILPPYFQIQSVNQKLLPSTSGQESSPREIQFQKSNSKQDYLMKRKSRRQSPLRMTVTPKSSARKPNAGDKKPTFSPTFSGCLGQKSINSISDLKDLVSSGFHDLKSNLIDRSHSEILKDLEASHSRLFKRFKIQAQACQQNMENAEKDFKKMSERINDSCEAMKDSYADFMVDVQATTSHVCKTTIPDLSKSFEKAIANLQSRYGITST